MNGVVPVLQVMGLDRRRKSSAVFLCLEASKQHLPSKPVPFFSRGSASQRIGGKGSRARLRRASR